ncbi:hypothetical protein EGH09_08705, partial [Brevibacillus laterosporus]
PKHTGCLGFFNTVYLTGVRPGKTRQWAFYNQMGMADKASRIGQLADELRVASGQEAQNK